MAPSHERLNVYRDAQLSAFEQRLQAIVAKAQQATLDSVMAQITIENGLIARTPANLRIIRRLNQIFMTELNKAGYTTLVNAFVGQFPSHLPILQDQLRTLSASMDEPLPELTFSLEDLNVLKSVAVTSAKMIRDVIATEATKATSRVLFSVGGLPFKEMVEIIQHQFGVSTSKAKVIADTAQATFYRVALERQYDKITKGTGLSLRYHYTGPRDERNRPFCAHLKADPKSTFTREEIDAMSNGQLPNVFITCGGYLCRHQWDVAGIERR